MTSKQVRQKFLDFFKSPPRNHKEIAPEPLVLENDPSTLFTSSGMQPLVPYLMGESYTDKSGKVVKRLTNSQPSIRLQDIEEVGDNRHTTFFEMLGNWSLGDYFKKEQLPWIWEFFTKELRLDPKRLYVTVYRGNKKFSVEKDEESVEIWKRIYEEEGISAKDVDNPADNGMQSGRIFYYDDNWWSRTGRPEEMPIGEIGGPDSEIFFEFTNVKHDLKYGRHCHPNDDCGRFLEIGNSVFMQYKKVSDDKLEGLPQKNVDFGGGFERILAAVNDTPDVFKTDLFEELVKKTEKLFSVNYGEDSEKTRSIRIVVEHLRASAMLISGNVFPSNKTQGYVLRRLLRKAIFHAYLLNGSNFNNLKLPTLDDLSSKGYPLKLKAASEINFVIEDEESKFVSTLKKGIGVLEKQIASGKVDGKLAFDLYQTNGIPQELSLEILQEKGMKFTSEDKKIFEEEFEKHKELSRSTSAGVFKGGLADHSPEVVKLHTATHLLLASLRNVLGEQVVQKGQNITKDRSRFDFPNSHKLTEGQLKQVENMMNDVIKKDLPVKYKILAKKKALKTGAVHAFNEKYADTVKVYFVGENIQDSFSKEFCGGPHVTSTGEIGHVRIKKQEKIGAGLIRLYIEAN
jgi:alanyl-tRNA synthetase